MNANCNTKNYYSINSEDYIEKTLLIDMNEHYNHFLKHLKKGSFILDVGFGSGRDLEYFSNNGYNVLGIDNVEEFVEHALTKGLNVKLQDFHFLEYKDEFDGIWACASLLHSNDINLAFNNLARALKYGGCFYLSMKIGSGSAIIDGRFYQYIDKEFLEKLCTIAGLKIIDIYTTEDLLNRKNKWLNALLTK